MDAEQRAEAQMLKKLLGVVVVVIAFVFAIGM